MIRSSFWIALVFAWIGSSFCYSLPVYAQEQDAVTEPDRILLIFKFSNLVDQYVFGYKSGDKILLPTRQVLNLLGYKVERSQDSFVYTFVFNNEGDEFTIDFANREATLIKPEVQGVNLTGGILRGNNREEIIEQFTLKKDDIYRSDQDFFLSIGSFKELFDLEFQVIFEELIIRLEDYGPYPPPVLLNYQRAINRDRVLQSRRNLYREKFPLAYGREWKVLDGGFLDYSFNSSMSEQSNSYALRLTPGIEFMGGALQGVFSAEHYSQSNSEVDLRDVKWKYGILENPYISIIQAGAINSGGLLSVPINGVSVTNSSIEPTRVVDQIPIIDQATPNSEIELYINDALIDYTTADGLGNYQFIIPVPYGNTSIERVVYDPSGTIRSVKEKIQTPQYFVASNTIVYDASAGYVKSLFRGQNTTNPFMAQGVVSYGLSSNNTIRLGFEHIQNTDTPNLIYGELNSRLFRTYYTKINVAPGYQYDFNINTLYANQASWSVGVTAFENSTLYNLQNERYEIRWQGSVPLIDQGFRMDLKSTGRFQNRSGLANATNYRFDLTSRLDRFNLGLSFREYKYGDYTFAPNQSTRYSASATYSFANDQNLPYFLRGDFVRVYAEYTPVERMISSTELHISKTITKTIRLSLDAGRNFLTNYNFIGFTLDVNTRVVRSSTNARYSRGSSSFGENLRGSVGFDSNVKKFLFENNEQVGSSVIDFQLFVDQNANNVFDGEDDVVFFNPMLIDQNAKIRRDADDQITRFQHLPQFNRINASIQEEQIKNPLLINLIDNFSFFTDPNVYKLVHIPLSFSGALSGVVKQHYGQEEYGRGGLTIQLRDQTDSVLTTVQSFSDGSYYFQNVIPGDYQIRIDTTQLNILDVNADPGSIDVNVPPSGEFFVLRDNNFDLNSRSPLPEFIPVVPPSCTELSPSEAAGLADMTAQFNLGNQGYWMQIASYKSGFRAIELLGLIQEEYGLSGDIILNEKTGLYAAILPTDGVNMAELSQYLKTIGINNTADLIDVDRAIDDVAYSVRLDFEGEEQFQFLTDLVDLFSDRLDLKLTLDGSGALIELSKAPNWNMVQLFMDQIESIAPDYIPEYHSAWEARMNYTMYLDFKPNTTDAERAQIMASICEKIPNVHAGQITIRYETGYLLSMGLNSWSALLDALSEYDEDQLDILFIVNEE